MGPGDFGQGDTTITRNDFVSTRDASIPWAKEMVPDWVPSLRRLRYIGSMVSRGPLPTVPNVLSLDLQAVTHGRRWVQVLVTSTEQLRGAPGSVPVTSEMAFGPSEFGSLWVSTAGLAQLRQGQVLDEDPVSKMRTIVSKINDASVTISSAKSCRQIDNQYDKRTGMLIASSFYNVLSRQQRTYRVQTRE